LLSSQYLLSNKNQTLFGGARQKIHVGKMGCEMKQELLWNLDQQLFHCIHEIYNKKHPVVGEEKMLHGSNEDANPCSSEGVSAVAAATRVHIQSKKSFQEI
jgi:hypothetical protein